MITNDPALDHSAPGVPTGLESACRPLETCGLTLLLLFPVWAVVPQLPLQLLNPAWAHQLASAFVNNSPLLVIGLALLRCSALLAPGRRFVQHWQPRLCRLAIFAAVFYLFLAPIDLVSTYRQLDGLRMERQARLRAFERRYVQITSVISRASDAADLSSQLRAMGAPELPPQDLALPLPVLKRQVFTSLQQTRDSLRARLQQKNPQVLWSTTGEGIRISLSALVIAVSLAGLGRTATSRVGLLTAWRQDLTTVQLRWQSQQQESQNQRIVQRQARELHSQQRRWAQHQKRLRHGSALQQAMRWCRNVWRGVEEHLNRPRR